MVIICHWNFFSLFIPYAAKSCLIHDMQVQEANYARGETQAAASQWAIPSPPYQPLRPLANHRQVSIPSDGLLSARGDRSSVGRNFAG